MPLIFAMVGVFYACSGSQDSDAVHRDNEGASYVWHVPSTFDSLPPVPHDNKMTPARIRLGEALFFDPRLSADGRISCGSCHRPEFAFADTTPVSIGVHGRRDKRNAPSLLNSAYQKRLFMEGGVPSLELQALGPADNSDEMGLLLSDAVNKIVQDGDYSEMAKAAYGGPMDTRTAAYALAAYQRSLISAGSPYDAFLSGDSQALDASQHRGMNLLFSERTSCTTCHSGFLFTDQGYHNIGLAESYADPGRGRLTHKPQDDGRFKTPSLRNVGITAPYMHDGSIRSLVEVIEFFDSGGHAHSNRDERIRPLDLSDQDKTDIVNFLHALTDTVYAQR